MTTLGIDQSYTSCGFCVSDADGNLLDFGLYRSTKTLDVYDRAVEVANFVADKIISTAATKLNIEGLAFGIRGDATRDLAGLLFTIITTVRRRCKGVTIQVIAPTSLKKFATKTGKSDKAAMIAALPKDVSDKFAEAKLKKTTGLTDVCDAYWLSQY